MPAFENQKLRDANEALRKFKKLETNKQKSELVDELRSKLNKFNEKTKKRILNCKCYDKEDRETHKNKIRNAFECVVVNV